MSELRIGLEGVAIAETKISEVRGDKGQLIYCGHWVQELVRKCSYEDVVYLLWNQQLPNAKEAEEFRAHIASKREIPQFLKQAIELMPSTLTPMEVLRTAISFLVPSEEVRFKPDQNVALEILAKAPTIIAYHHNYFNKTPIVAPDMKLSHAANYLYMLNGKVPNEGFVKALDAYMMLSADHGSNASTFTARVITSTQSDVTSAIVGAIGALIGPLHGGAPSMVDDMLDDVGSLDNVEPWIRDQIEKGNRLMGFGHRVYKTYDPRAMALKEIVKGFAHENYLFQLSLKIEEVAVRLLNEYKPGRNLYPNLEFWAAGVLRTVELPRQLYTPTFAIARIGGWLANIFEQANNNRLIRPASIYVGPEPEGTPQ